MDNFQKELLNKIAVKVYRDYKQLYDYYDNKATEEVGQYVSDTYHTDTGDCVADNSYYSNEDEIEDYARELFAEDYIKDNDLNTLDFTHVMYLISVGEKEYRRQKAFINNGGKNE